MANLTNKEAMIARLVIDGVDTKAIAVEAEISYRTVTMYLERLRMKTGTVGKNRVALANTLRKVCGDDAS